MKNLIILITISLLSTISYGQTDTTSIQNDSVPVYQCNLKKDEVDDFTGSIKKVTYSDKFIAHTDSSLMKYYKRKKNQYFEVDAYTARVDDVYAIYFYITIQTKKAYDYYGVLSSKAKVIFKLEDGSTMEFKIGSSDYGDVNYDGGYTTYSTYFVVEDWQMQILEKLSVQKVRIYWSKGYEDYDCDSPDLLKEKLSCLH